MSTLPPTLIVGLGNPGPKYANTRHNLGFLVLDALTDRVRVDKREHRFSGQLLSVRFGGRRLYFLKPLTFMNASGTAVAAACRGLDREPGEVLVIYDCMDLPIGRIRLRTEGGSGGHKGLESIIECLGSRRIPRVRIGIGRPEHPGLGIEYVLSPWAPEEAPAMTAAVDAAAEAVLTAARQGFEKAMNRFNTWRFSPETGNDVRNEPDKQPHGAGSATATPRKETNS